MEEFVIGTGFGITCTCFFFALCINTNFAWGSLIGLIMIAFGEIFKED